ncbi:neutral zinc metallopeptidase [Geodermatophilus sp. SYSU D00815]
MTRVRIPSRLRVALAATATGGLLLTGCTSTVVGIAAPAGNALRDATPEEFPIAGAADGDEVDQEARNALADLYAFWEEAYPEAFGAPFEPLAGGVFSVDPDDVDPAAYPDGVSCGLQPERVENNALYCNAPGRDNADSITYDRVFLAELSASFDLSLVAVVMAHEFGHAIQDRFGFRGASINQETQADCLAGAWTGWVAAGNGRHTSLRAPELDQVLRGYLQVADPVGTDPSQEGAHGSYFDRVSAIAEGFDQGVAACRDNYGEGRIFTAAAADPRDPNEGDAPYDQTLDFIEQTLPPFWADVFPVAFGREFEEPALEPFEGTAPECVDGDRDLGYCESDSTVYYDERDLTLPAYEELGDYAVATAISTAYSLAVRSEAGLSTDDAEATRSSVCLTGWYTAQLFSGAFEQVVLSPGDVDEAVEFLLAHGLRGNVFPNSDVTGFELLRSFRSGFLDGGGPCEVGIDG